MTSGVLLGELCRVFIQARSGWGNGAGGPVFQPGVGDTSAGPIGWGRLPGVQGYHIHLCRKPGSDALLHSCFMRALLSAQEADLSLGISLLQWSAILKTGACVQSSFFCLPAAGRRVSLLWLIDRSLSSTPFNALVALSSSHQNLQFCLPFLPVWMPISPTSETLCILFSFLHVEI